MTDLRCHECLDGESHFDHGLREKVAAAIRRFPNSEAPQWIGPESVLCRVEEHAPQGADRYFVAPGAYGDLTIWRDVPDHDPIELLRWRPDDAELFDLAARGLERRP